MITKSEEIVKHSGRNIVTNWLIADGRRRAELEWFRREATFCNKNGNSPALAQWRKRKFNSKIDWYADTVSSKILITRIYEILPRWPTFAVQTRHLLQNVRWFCLEVIAHRFRRGDRLAFAMTRRSDSMRLHYSTGMTSSLADADSHTCGVRANHKMLQPRDSTENADWLPVKAKWISSYSCIHCI